MLLNISEIKNEALLQGLREISPMLRIKLCTDDGSKLLVRESAQGGFSVKKMDDGIAISFSRLPDFYKALAVFAANQEDIAAKAGIAELGAMLDCSRNAVLTVNGAKTMIRYFALMGYNYLMLYTEDTLEVKEYPYFGYMRGRYSKAELAEIEQYCGLFGIELIPCIQTLAHLNQALRWSAFQEITDLQDILLIGEEKTYAFIESIIKTCAENFTSKRIHVGMDEAHLVGLGRYLRQNGYKDRTQIMIEHVQRVIDICKKYGFSPMMWSDMFFRLAFGDYYAKENDGIPEAVRAQIPKDIAMVYWDYYSHDKAKYESMFAKHKQMGNEVIFAAGAWKWSGVAPDNRFSIKASEAALAAAAESGIQDVVVTAWGDDGGEAPMLSVLPGFMACSEMKYFGAFDAPQSDTRFKALTGMPLADFLTVDLPSRPVGVPESACDFSPCKYLLFQDVLAGIFDLNLIPEQTAAFYREACESIQAVADTAPPDFAPMFRAYAVLCKILAVKTELGRNLRTAYAAKDLESLKHIGEQTIPALIADIEDFYEMYKTVWLQMCKPFGLEVQDIHYGGLIMRLKTVSSMLHDFVSGASPAIAELEEEVLPYSWTTVAPEKRAVQTPYVPVTLWQRIVSVNFIAHG